MFSTVSISVIFFVLGTIMANAYTSFLRTTTTISTLRGYVYIP